MTVGDLQKVFGRNLRQHRKHLGLSQEEFADLLDVHRTYVGGVERGERNLSLQSIEVMCSRLDLPAEILLFSDPGQ